MGKFLWPSLGISEVLRRFGRRKTRIIAAVDHPVCQTTARASMMSSVSQFEEIWVADFEFRCPDRELPTVHCMVAREVISGRLIRLSGDDLTEAYPVPFDTASRALFVAFFCLCRVRLFPRTWLGSLPSTLDLYVEFRRLRCGTGVSKRGSRCRSRPLQS